MKQKYSGILLDAIDIVVNNKLTHLDHKMDKTYIGQILSQTYNGDQYVYKVIANGVHYEIKSQNSYAVGKKVIVKIPCGNLLDIFIDKEVDEKKENDSEGGEIEWLKY